MAGETCYAVAAGTFGALGALSAKFAFGKLSFAEDRELAIIALTAFVLSNILMWWSFTKSLSTAQNTMQPLMFNMGTNFMLTGFIGAFIFNEVHNWLWWFGLACVISGLAVISSVDTKNKEE